MKIGIPISISVLLWTIVGVIRYITEEILQKKQIVPSWVVRDEIKKIAVCLPAHNEEVVIKKAIHAVKRQVPLKQIYLVSDGSSDKTAIIARKEKCQVLEQNPGKGKAKALTALIKKYRLYDRYQYILFVDSDTILDRQFIKRSLRFLFLHPETAAIAAYAQPHWKKKSRISIGDFISAYRTKLYKILQLCIMYGQTWKHANVNPVVPGFAALYRVSVLKKLKIDTPGIWIEDFNLAFQIHKKNLGVIAHHPGIIATYQDPATVRDYWSQVKRWNVGFFQTVRVQSVWPSKFWLSLLLFTAEVVLLSLAVLLLPFIVIVSLLQLLQGLVPQEIIAFSYYIWNNYFEIFEFFTFLLLIDYLTTILVALNDRKFRIILYGPFFVFFQFLNSLIFIASFWNGFFTFSSGVWKPAKRT